MAEALDPSVVRPSRHSLYMRGFHASVRPDDVRRHFAERGHACSLVFSANVRGAVNVALRFETHEEARRVLHKYSDGQTPLLGCRVSIVWFRDMQAARERVRQDPDLRRMLERRGAIRPTALWRGAGGSGGGWQRRISSDGDYQGYAYEEAAEEPTSSRSSRSRSRSNASVGSRSRHHNAPPPAPPPHRRESPPSPSRGRSVRSRSPSRPPSAPPPPVPPTAGQLVRRRKAEIEAAYRQDCETFAAVVKLLLRQDPGLDGPIQTALKASLRDIGDRSVAELRQFIDGLQRDAAADGGDCSGAA